MPDLVLRVRRHLAEAGSGAHNDNAIQDAVKRSARDLARQYHLFKGVATLTPTDGRAALPADFAGVETVRAGGVTLPLHTPAEVAARTPWTLPAYYWGEEYETDGALLLYGPVPGPVVLTYHRVPADPTQSREAWGGKYEEYHDLIALHAAHSLQGQTGASAAKDGIWLQRLEQRKDEFRAYLASARLGTTRMQFTPRTRFPSQRY